MRIKITQFGMWANKRNGLRLERLRIILRPRGFRKSSHFMLVVISNALLKLFLYGNIVSINSSIYSAAYGLHGEKNQNLIKPYRVLRIRFLSHFCQGACFYGFPEKK